MRLSDIPIRPQPPQPWQEGEKIPWNDPDFSRRMLQEHLSQEHDAASRRSARIDRHTEWIFGDLLEGCPSKVLDLACGPGLYASRLARLGCTCLGIDFSPASIEYASQYAAAENLACRYVLSDLRSADFEQGWDLALFLYGEFNVFRPDDARLLLSKVRQALKPGATLLLELSTYEAVKKLGSQPPTWYSQLHGLFSDQPHIVLYEAHWDADQAAAVERYYIVDAASGAVERIAATTRAYTTESITTLLQVCGFGQVQILPGMGEQPEQADFYVLTAQAS